MLQAREDGFLENPLLKQTLDIILKNIGLKQCDDVHHARKIIFEAALKDRNVQAHIEEVITLAANIVYCGEAGQEAPIDEIKSFILQKYKHENGYQGDDHTAVVVVQEQGMKLEEQKMEED